MGQVRVAALPDVIAPEPAAGLSRGPVADPAGAVRQAATVGLCAVIGLLALLGLAACRSAETPAVASAQNPAAQNPAAQKPSAQNPSGQIQSPHPAAGSATSPSDTDYDKALRYTRCMTQHGAPMADPVEGQQLILGNMILANEPPSNYGLRLKAFPSCQQYLPSTWPIKMDPAQIARDRPFAECMRQHGIDWPEPDADGMIPFPADSTTHSAAYTAAEDACAHLVDDPAVRANG